MYFATRPPKKDGWDTQDDWDDTHVHTHSMRETKSDRTRGREGMMRHINELVIGGIQNIWYYIMAWHFQAAKDGGIVCRWYLYFAWHHTCHLVTTGPPKKINRNTQSDRIWLVIPMSQLWLFSECSKMKSNSRPKQYILTVAPLVWAL